MANFIVYDSTGKILRVGFCQKELISAQANDGEFAMEGIASDADHKIVNGEVVPKSQDDLDDQLYISRANIFPNLNMALSDQELNEEISNYFLGRVDPKVWRKENYQELRKVLYPPIEDYLDAQIKISAGGDLAEEGQTQLDNYNQTCLDAKARFPKP